MAKKKRRSLFYRVSAWLHLWLGLVTGIVVIVVSITGAILTFEEEFRVLFQPYQKVKDKGQPFLSPSVLAESVKREYHLSGVSSVIYRGRTRSAVVPWYGDRKNYLVNYVDPFTGKPLYSQRLDDDFFRIMIIGHYQLWLPRQIGQPVVAWSTLIFVVTLITGLIMWWPKKWNKTTRKQSFSIRTKASFKRLNYDLHNVPGFYALLIALVLGLTGMVFGMKCFSRSVYWAASGGLSEKTDRVSSDTTVVAMTGMPEEDVLFRRLVSAETDMESQSVSFGYPYGKTGTWTVAVNPAMGTRFREQQTYYEQHSLKQLQKDPSFSEANGGEKLRRLNYDLHVGAVGGIATKFIAFLVCIISASLPVSGFIIWIGKKKKSAPTKIRNTVPATMQAEVGAGAS